MRTGFSPLVSGIAVVALLVSQSAVVIAQGWCPPGQPTDPPKDPPYAACPIDPFLVKFTISDDGVTTCELPPDASTVCEVIYPDFASQITDAATCKSVCLANYNADPLLSLCNAYTFIEGEGDELNLCYFTAECSTPDGELDGEPCVVGSGHCFSGVVCAGGAAEVPCAAPQKINHDYGIPQNQHWSTPCNDKNGIPDKTCNIYRDGSTCQHMTVCTLEPKCGDDAVVKHTCKEGKWYNGNDVEIPEDSNTVEAWKDLPCYPCKTEEKKLLITPEPGLSLVCLADDEPGAINDDGKIEIMKGPCNMYCDGTFVHSINCDPLDSKWKDENNICHDAYYCWKKPPPTLYCN